MAEILFGILALIGVAVAFVAWFIYRMGKDKHIK